MAGTETTTKSHGLTPRAIPNHFIHQHFPPSTRTPEGRARGEGQTTTSNSKLKNLWAIQFFEPNESDKNDKNLMNCILNFCIYVENVATRSEAFEENSFPAKKSNDYVIHGSFPERATFSPKKIFLVGRKNQTVFIVAASFVHQPLDILNREKNYNENFFCAVTLTRKVLPNCAKLTSLLDTMC